MTEEMELIKSTSKVIASGVSFGYLLKRLLDLGFNMLGISLEKKHIVAVAEGNAFKSLIEAHNQLQVEGIKNGTLIYASESKKVLAADEPDRKQPSTINYKLLQGALAYTASQDYKRFMNLLSVLSVAFDIASDSTNNKATPEEVSKEFIDNWQRYAESISGDYRQKLWAEILLREASKPGSFSLRTLEALSKMNQADAVLLEKYAAIALGESILALDDATYQSLGYSFADFVYLEEIGILTAVSGSINQQFNVIPTPPLYCANIGYRTGVLKLFTSDESKTFTFRAYNISKIGREIFEFLSVPTDVNYLKELVNLAKKQNCAIHKFCDEPGSNKQ